MTKVRDNFNFYFENGIDIGNKIIEIKGEIDEEEASRVLKALQLFNKSPERPVHIYINSDGGSIYDGFFIYDLIRNCDCEVNTYAMGRVMSAGTIILLAGDKRYSYANSKIMFHSVMSESKGTVKAFESQYDDSELQDIYKDMCKIYGERTGLTYKQWYSKIRYKDVYYKPEKAKEVGIIHEIIDRRY